METATDNSNIGQNDSHQKLGHGLVNRKPFFVTIFLMLCALTLTSFWIANSHLMPEFFISLTSSSDHWMFISSNGALTAGRKNATHALFPYYSADKISDLRETIGPKSIFEFSIVETLHCCGSLFHKEVLTNFAPATISTKTNSETNCVWKRSTKTLGWCSGILGRSVMILDSYANAN